MLNGHNAALRVAIINCVINAMLALIKLTAGWYAHSDAVISDGLHSVTDVISTVIVMIGIGFSMRRADAKHPYGHERLECVAATLLSIVIGMTGVGIGVSGAVAVCRGAATKVVVGAAAFWAAVVSIITKETMFRYTRRYARRCGSSALEADAWHQRVDAMSSIGSMIGVVGARIGVPILDSVASMMIGVLIVKAAVSIFADAMRKMTDRACDPMLEREIVDVVRTCEGVVSLEMIKTRLFGDRVYAEITVGVDRRLTSEEAYTVVLTVRTGVMSTFAVVKECSVHIHPLED